MFYLLPFILPFINFLSQPRGSSSIIFFTFFSRFFLVFSQTFSSFLRSNISSCKVQNLDISGNKLTDVALEDLLSNVVAGRIGHRHPLVGPHKEHISVHSNGFRRTHANFVCASF
jgi:hypothetical protein